MELVQKEEISLGLESYDALGFNSQEELELEISKLIKIRPEFEKIKLNFIVSKTQPNN